jgi:hypothetical protein
METDSVGAAQSSLNEIEETLREIFGQDARAGY